MKTKTTSRLLLIGAVMALCSISHPQSALAQCLQPQIKIDGNIIIADENDAYGLKLPTWLKTGQTLAIAQRAFSISVIEFTVNGTALDYSQNLSVTTIQTVPANKVWKIESVLKDASASSLAQNPLITTYSIPSTYTFTPACNSDFRVQVWSGGGGSGSDDGWACGWGNGGGGGGGGGYSEGTYTLVGGTNYIVVVGAAGTAGANLDGGTGGTSSVSVIPLSVTGGGGGKRAVSPCGAVGTGGAGGVASGGQINTNGQAGANNSGGTGGIGGTAAGTGGGAGGGSNAAGTFPGGGGGGASYAGGVVGKSGATGKVIISKSGGIVSGGTGRDKVQMSGVINATITTSCGYVVPDGYVFRLDGVTTTSNGQSLYMGTTCGAQDRGAIVIYSQTFSGSQGNTNTSMWPYPMWIVAGTYFYYTSGNAYIHGAEFTIE